MQIEEIVKQYVFQEMQDRGSEIENRYPEELEEMDLLANSIIDSLGVPRLVSFVERQFDIQVPFEDITVENFSSIKNITAYINAKR